MNVSDLDEDPVVVWQQRYYVIIAVFACFFMPTLIAYYGWNDFLGGLLYASYLRLFVHQQITYLVNSLAHSEWAGDKSYSDRNTAVNNVFLG